MSETLFPDLVSVEPDPAPKVSADRKRTLRQHTDIAAGRHPLTRGPVRQPEGETCGSCAYRQHFTNGNRNWPKCTGHGRVYVTHAADMVLAEIRRYRRRKHIADTVRLLVECRREWRRAHEVAQPVDLNAYRESRR